MDTATQPVARPNRPLSAFLQTLMGPALEPLADGELLARFTAERDEAAFAHLVRRHGPMVLAVARRVLRQSADAEDVGQAVFLLLAQKAHRFGRSSHVGGFLHAVATRTAWKARARRLRRQAREAKAARCEAIDPELPDDLPMLIDRALQTLPAKYRDAVILCDLEGVPRQLAAERLGVPLGTLSSRLARAHERLARRLTWPLAAVTAALAAGSAAEGLAHATLFTLAHSPTRLATGAVATLVMEVSRAMLWTKIKAVVAVGFMAAAATGGGVAVSRYAAAGDGDKGGGTPTSVARAGGTPTTAAKPAALPDALPLNAEAKRKELFDQEAAKLVGAWAVESSTYAGKPGDGYRKPEPYLMRFEAAGRATIAPPFEKPAEGRYRVNPDRTPKQLNITFADGGLRGWRVSHLSYKLDGDTLTTAGYHGPSLALGFDYPAGFTAAEQPAGAPGLEVTVFKRVKPDEKPKPAEPAKDKPAAAAPPGRLKELRRERAAVLEKSIAENVGILKAGQLGIIGGDVGPFFNQMAEDRRQLSRAELELAETDAERVASLEKLVAGTKADEAYLIDRVKVGIIRPQLLLPATATRLDAEIELEKARAAAARPAADPVAERKRLIDAEVAKLVGTWELVAATTDDAAVDLKGVTNRYTFDAFGEFQTSGGDPKDARAANGEFRVYPHRTPRQLTLNLEAAPWHPMRRCHYEFAGDSLRLAFFGESRPGQVLDLPRGFTAAEQPKGSQPLHVYVLKRVKP